MIMEPKFTVHSRYTQKEAIRFNRALLFNVWHLKKTIIISNVALLVMIVTSNIAHNYMFAISLVLALAVFNWYFFFGVDQKAARAYQKNKQIQDSEFVFHFYDDQYESAAADGTVSSVPYSTLHKIIETPTNIYILHAPTVGTIIQKDNCTADFIDFIHNIKNRYNL